MVEPLEETRSELLFATEPLLASLAACIKTSKRGVTPLELDEIEVKTFLFY
jgi:SCY1-like protein 2